jgi:hypothetical protein
MEPELTVSVDHARKLVGRSQSIVEDLAVPAFPDNPEDEEDNRVVRCGG